MDEPITRFRAALSKTPERIAASEVGQTFRLPLDPLPDTGQGELQIAGKSF